MKLIKFLVFLFVVGSLGFVSCKDKEENDPCSNDFDQAALFTNVADNIILPSYQRLNEKTELLNSATQNFLSTTNETELEILRTAFRDAYTVWQEVAQFEFGPAEEIFLRNSVNNFPANVSQIEFNIENEVNNFNDPETYDQGFPALDYLLYGVAGSDDLAATVMIYAESANKEKYKKYLEEVVADIHNKVTQTNDKWQGDFRNSFVTKTGTAAGNSLSQIINSWNQNYELIKRNKIGVPSGVLDLNFPLPDKVEAFYSGISTSLAVAALKSSERLYIGVGEDGTNGIGLDDFLNEINAEKDGRPLDTVIKEQFTNAINAVEVLSDPLSESIDNDEIPAVMAYTEIAKQVINIKTDLPSVLCISITYVDNPSDSD